MSLNCRNYLSVVGAGLLASASFGGSASAQSVFDGCPSAKILERFVEFGRTGQMPADPGGWLNTPEAQYIAPWSPFDNTDSVGICRVLAWLVHTDEGRVLIDTLYDPYQQVRLDDIAATGTKLLPGATFEMTGRGPDEAMASVQAFHRGRVAQGQTRQAMTPTKT